MPDVMNRDYVQMQVIAVLQQWNVTPSGRGTGVGDVDYWCDQIIAHKGWEQYWVDRIGEECQKAGYSQHSPSEQEPGPSPFDVINEKLDQVIQSVADLKKQQIVDTEKIQQQIDQVVKDAEKTVQEGAPLILKILSFGIKK